MCVCVCMYTYICMHICICVCTNLYKYKLLSPFLVVVYVWFQGWTLILDNQLEGPSPQKRLILPLSAGGGGVGEGEHYSYHHCLGFVYEAISSRHSLTADFLVFFLLQSFHPTLLQCSLSHRCRSCCRCVHWGWAPHSLASSPLCWAVVSRDVFHLLLGEASLMSSDGFTYLWAWGWDSHCS